MYSTSKPLIILVGATASGKTRLAIAISKLLNAEIISADSRQVYRHMNIGTGKDLSSYQEAGVPYHLIDIMEPGDKYHVDAFKTDFFNIYQDLQKRDKYGVLCGGTALYINALIKPSELTVIPKNEALREVFNQQDILSCIHALREFPQEYWAHVDLSSKKRVIRALEIAAYLKHNLKPPESKKISNYLFIGLVDDVEIRRQKIKARLHSRLNEGLIQEVKALHQSGLSFDMMDYYGLEYKFVGQYLQGNISREEMETGLYNGICQYAKRQMTFFRKLDREGANIHWIDAGLAIEQQLELALNHIQKSI